MAWLRRVATCSSSASGTPAPRRSRCRSTAARRPEIIATANAFAQSIPAGCRRRWSRTRPAGRTGGHRLGRRDGGGRGEVDRRHHRAAARRGLPLQGHRRPVPLGADLRAAADRGASSSGHPVPLRGRTGLFCSRRRRPRRARTPGCRRSTGRTSGTAERSRPTSTDVVDGFASADFSDGKPIPDFGSTSTDWKDVPRRRTRRPVNLVGDFYTPAEPAGRRELDLDDTAGLGPAGLASPGSRRSSPTSSTSTRRAGYVEEDGRAVFRGGSDRGSLLLAAAAQLPASTTPWTPTRTSRAKGPSTSTPWTSSPSTRRRGWSGRSSSCRRWWRAGSRRGGRAGRRLADPRGCLPDAKPPPLRGQRGRGAAAVLRRPDAGAGRACTCPGSEARATVPAVAVPRGSRRLAAIARVADHSRCRGRPSTRRSRGAAARVSFSDLAVFEECGHGIGSAGARVPAGTGHRARLRQGHPPRPAALAETATASGAIPDGGRGRRRSSTREFYLPSPIPRRVRKRCTEAARGLVERYLTTAERPAPGLGDGAAVRAPPSTDGIVRGRADVILDEEGGRPDRLAIVDYKIANDPRATTIVSRSAGDLRRGGPRRGAEWTRRTSTS